MNKADYRTSCKNLRKLLYDYFDAIQHNAVNAVAMGREYGQFQAHQGDPLLVIYNHKTNNAIATINTKYGELSRDQAITRYRANSYYAHILARATGRAVPSNTLRRHRL